MNDRKSPFYATLLVGCVASLLTVGLLSLKPTPAVYAQGASAPQQDVDNGQAPATNDAKTQTADTAILYTVPPCGAYKARVWSVNYMPAGTAHNMYLMPAIGNIVTTTTVDSVVGATTITVRETLTDAGGGAVAANDYVTVGYGDGTWGALKVSSVTGLVLTVPTLTKEVKSGTNVYFHGAPGDHALRQYVITASTRFSLSDYKVGLCTTRGKNQPIIVLVDNVTAAGRLDHVGAGPVRTVD